VADPRLAGCDTGSAGRVSAVVVAAVGHAGTSLWYLTRATGVVALVLLSAAMVLGIVSSVGWVSERWPRFVSQAVHRNLSLLALAFVGVHIVTTVADGYVPITLIDAVVPFRSPYRPLWVGLGACAFDLMVALGVTTGLRRRIGVRVWRAVHWLAYACWPVAVFHALGSGSDTRLAGVQALYVVCIGAVFVALVWRIALARSATPNGRLVAAAGAASVLVAGTVFAGFGPLRPGWSQRSGTSSALLASLSTARAAPAAAGTASTTPSRSSAPSVPFQSTFSGTYSVAGPDGAGDEHLVMSTHLSTGVPMTVSLVGPPVDDGLIMRTGEVTLGDLAGPITSLDGGAITATVRGGGVSDRLSLLVALDHTGRGVSGSVTGRLPAGGGTAP